MKDKWTGQRETEEKIHLKVYKNRIKNAINILEERQLDSKGENQSLVRT